MWVERAKDRWMNFYHVFLVSLAARACANSSLRPEKLREVSEGAGKDLASYMRLLGIDAIDVGDALALLNASMALADHVLFSTGGGLLEVRLHRPSCRLCLDLLNPGGEPIPEHLIAGLLKGFLEGLGVAELEYDGFDHEEKGAWYVFRYRVKKLRASPSSGS